MQSQLYWILGSKKIRKIKPNKAAYDSLIFPVAFMFGSSPVGFVSRK